MKLPFFSKQKNFDEPFIGLFLKEEEGIAFFMIKYQQEVEVKEKIKFNYTNGWENLTEDVDEILYKFEKKYQLEISKTIFFVYSHLIDDKTKNIKEPYLNKIKELVKNLQLEALGYIESFEAISFYLENKEEAPLTAILLELDKKQLSLFVYKGGKLNYKNILARTDNIIDDFTLGINGIKEKKILLPSRIIIYDSDSIDDVAAKIISYHFDGDYFVQIPKIDILKEDEVINGLVQIFSKQIKINNVKEPEIIDKKFGFVIGGDFEKKEEIKNKKIMPKITFPKINLSFIKGKTAIVIGLLTIFLSLFLNEYFFHKADLTIYLPNQLIEEKLNQSINYEIASTSEEITETILTTGKKEVGDKAKGTVIIHNFDDNEKVFPKGTVLEASGIKFILDNDVKVASASLAADGSAKLPGKNNATITSEIIGSEANLTKGSRFKIDNLSTNIFFAINESALSGGTKKEIRTVSALDIKNLEKNVLDKAEKQIKISSSFKKNKLILKDLSETVIVDSKYSKEIGEEGDRLSLNAKVKKNYYLYDRDLLIKYLLEKINSQLKKGFFINRSNFSYKINQANINKNKVNLEIIVKAKATPKIDENKVIKKILGKNQNKLETILKSDFEIQGYNIVIHQPLPGFKSYLPFLNKNINLTISSL